MGVKKQRTTKPYPLVAIVGAPNVGKSTLFNRLSRQKKAIVHRQSGMTRDWMGVTTTLGPRTVELADTGGMLPNSRDGLSQQISRQSSQAIHKAQVVLLVVDGRAGLTAADQDLSQLLRRQGKPVILVVNKLDTHDLTSAVADFLVLGIDNVVGISAEHALGLGDLEEALTLALPAPEPPQDVSRLPEVSVALIGRPNVGKSSLVNRLLHDERVLVSDQPGTTRDPVDTFLRAHGHAFRLVDTAGLRRRTGSVDSAEGLAIQQARRALGQAEVAMVVMDATSPITSGDLAILGEAVEAGRALLPVLNKWDLVIDREEEARRVREETSRRLKFAPHAGLLTVSAKTGLRVPKLLEQSLACHQDFQTRLPTSAWNRALATAVKEHRPPVVRGTLIRFYYAVQTATAPPKLEIFTNTRLALPESYRRYLVARIRALTGLERTPLRLSLRPRK